MGQPLDVLRIEAESNYQKIPFWFERCPKIALIFIFIRQTSSLTICHHYTRRMFYRKLRHWIERSWESFLIIYDKLFVLKSKIRVANSAKDVYHDFYGD